ncbi:unnamed protein product, partial [Adineta ricciae]
MCSFLNLCSAMLASCLCDIQRDAISQFQLSTVVFLTKLQFDEIESNPTLRYYPSRDDYFNLLQLVLQQPQQMLAEYWGNILELNICLKDTDKFGEIARQEGLTNNCEICGENLYPGLQETCKCKKQQSKGFINEPNYLVIKGHGFFGSATRTEILPFELIFIKDTKYEEEIKNILSQFGVSFDELDAYCESNEWLCEIRRFCLQWTPSQMKEMTEMKEVFPIQEQLKILRDWIDKTRTFEMTYSTSSSPYVIQIDCSIIREGLFKAVSTIYSDLGRYLYEYALMNAQLLIEKFQHASEVLDQRPTALEDYARYVSFLTPHKAELASNQQTIDYFTNLFETIFTHFGHFRLETEEDPIDKSLVDMWKLFQKKLSNAADFIVQEMLIVKERLREIFDKYFHECEIIHYQSTTGVFLDPTQDPLEMIKQLRQNCIRFQAEQEQLKQYADWRASIAANSSNSTYDQDSDLNDLNTVAYWSTEIDHRKDLWKYVEITSTTIKEWKLTFINRFNIPRSREKIECWLRIAEDFNDKVSPNDPVLCYWIKILKDFEQNINLLEKLLSDAMTSEQWRLLFRANGHDYDPKFNYRIQDLIDLNILRVENFDVFLQIHKHATREQKLKEKLTQMQTWIDELYYRMIKYGVAHKTTTVRHRLTSSYRQRLSRYRELRSRASAAQENPPEPISATESSIGLNEESYLMINSQEILRLIEDRLLLLHTNEPFHIDIDNCREQFQQYYTLFDAIKTLTQLWYETQNRWIFVRSALANLIGVNDDRIFFRELHQKFIHADQDFRNFQKTAFQNPSTANLAKVNTNQKQLQTWLNTFNELIAQLEFYLNEQYRSNFGRFYFLSTDELVNLISFGLDPRYYIPYVRQLFRGIHNIQFQLPEQSIGASTNQAVNSAAMDIYAYRLEGTSISNKYQEELPLISKLKLCLPTIDSAQLNTRIISSQSVVKWFQSLENLMKYSLAKSVFQLFDEKIENRLENFLTKKTLQTSNDRSYPLQVRLLVEHVFFSLTMQKHIENQSYTPMRNIKSQIEHQIETLMKSPNTQQNGLIIQQLYFRDVLTKFIEDKTNLTLKSYEWLSLMKYEIDPNARTDQKIHFVQFLNRIHYNFEYIEPSSTFIISPLMERTLFQLTQAVCAYRIGVLHAKPQSGRLTTIQTLAQLCGTNLIAVSCQATTEIEHIRNVHQGLITSNTWCVLKDMQRLTINCLSTLAVAMRHIRVQLEEYRIRFQDFVSPLKRIKSQSDLSFPSESCSVKKHASEYPMEKKFANEHNFIISNNQEILQYPLTYGLFATFDDFYQPLSPTIKFDCRTISISRPDLKIITESFLYLNRLYTLQEQHKCQVTARNLVDFIESLRFIYDEMKTFCSPYVLLRSIIEQSAYVNMKEAILTVLKQNHLYDSHIDGLIDKFFSENQNTESDEEDNDELSCVDILKQEAFDDKIAFDDAEQLFQNASRLMYAIQRHDMIFLIGQSGSAKSGLIRLAERTFNKQMNSANVNPDEHGKQTSIIIETIFPNSYDEDQFYQTKDSFIEQWKQQQMIKLANDISSEQYWIVLDIDSHSNWLTPEKIRYLYKELQTTMSCYKGILKIIIECDDLLIDISHHGQIFVLNVDKFHSRMKLIQSAVTNLELKLHLRDGTLSSIQQFVNDTIEPYINFLQTEHIHDAYINHFTDSFIKILCAFIEQHVIDVQNHLDALNYVFAYCFIWSYAHPIHPKYEQQINSFVRDLLKQYHFSSNDCKLFDFYPDMPAARFIPIHQWLKAHDIAYNSIPEFNGAMRLMSILIAYNQPIGIYSSEQGFGKTTLMNTLLTNVSHHRMISTGERKCFLRDEVFRYTLPLLTHSKSVHNTKYVLWFEDVKTEDTELIRSLIDEYSSSKQQSLNIVLTGQSFHSYPKRFSRHFIPIIIHQSISTLIDSIYSIPIKNWLEEFSADAITHPLELAHACVLTLAESFEFLKENFINIQWNLHNVEAIVNGMFLLEGKLKRTGGGASKVSNKISTKHSKKKQDEQLATLVRLFCHELSRIICDRLIDAQDRVRFQEFLCRTIITNFCTELEFYTLSSNVVQINQTTDSSVGGRKQVKFKAGLVEERTAIECLDGPIISFGKIIGIPKLKDISQVPAEGLFEKLIQSTYFSKSILAMHNEFTNVKDPHASQYQESNDNQMSTALRSCQSQWGKSTHMDLVFLPRTMRHLTNLVRLFSLSQNGHALLRANQIGLGRQDLVQFAAFITEQQFSDAHSYVPTIDENESVKQCLRTNCLLAGLKQKNIVVLIRENLLSDEMVNQLYLFTCEGFYPGLFSNEELIRIASALSPSLPSNRRTTKTNSVLKTFFARIRRRLHLVILENDQHLRHSGLLSSCYVEEYQNWTKDEIVTIAKYWMTKILNSINAIDSTASFDLACQALADIHLSLDHFRLFTLKNIRKTIEIFFKFYQIIQLKEARRLSRCESMLHRTNKSRQLIEMNEQLCVELQNEIDHLQGKLAELDHELQLKKKNFSLAVEDCREEEKLLNEMRTALERLKKDVEAAVENANPQYENALNALRLLNKADYDEIRTFRQPPQPVLAVMNTICIMFNRKPEWNEAKILTVKEDFFDDLVFYDKDNVSDEVFDMLTKIVSFDTFTPTYVATASKAASSLCAWILAVYEYAKVARAQKALREQVKAYEKLYNKRQQILGEKRLYAEKLKEELADFITKRREQFAELQSKVKRLNHLRSVIDATRAMLQLIDEDIQHWQNEVQQGRLNQQTAITDALQISLYFSYLSQFNVDQRQEFLSQWQTNVLQPSLPVRSDFNLLNMIFNEKEFNDYLLQYDSVSINDQNAILNAVILANQLHNTFVLFVNNPENDTSLWHNLLHDFNGEEASYEIQLYLEYKQNRISLPSGTSSGIAAPQDQSQIRQRISSSKTIATEVTEKSSIWDSASNCSRPGTGTRLAKPAGKFSLNDFEQKKYPINIPEFSLDEYERPKDNIIHLSGKQSEDFDKDLLIAMFFGNIVIVDECDLLDLNPFIYRFLCWSSRHDQYTPTFPNLFRFGDQEIFINSSFRLILNYHQIDRSQWRNLLLNNRLINTSFGLKKLEIDFWLRLIEHRCQKDFIKQVRSNYQRQLTYLNEQYQRRENLVDILETKENLTIDSNELLADLKKSNENRISIETTLNEYRIQFNVLCTRTGGEAYKDISKQLAQLYILLRDGVNQLKLPIQWFLQILTKNLPRRVEITKNTDLSNYNSDM